MVGVVGSPAMFGRREPMPSKRVYAWLAVIGTVALMVGLGFWRLFSHFPGYDDEGYIMLTVRNYLEHGGLFVSVYSQYGPGFYVLMDLLFGWGGFEVSHTSARWFTLTLWLGAAIGCAEVVRHHGRSATWAWGAGVATFMFLYQFSEEAFHPGVVVVFILPWCVRWMGACARSDRWLGLAAVAGGTTAFLTLVKVNVGVLFGVGVVTWYALASTSERSRVVQQVLAGSLGAVALTGLLGGALQEPWVRTFWFVTAVGLVGLILVTDAQHKFATKELVVGGLAGFAVGALVIGTMWFRGTSLPGLLEGVLWGPLRHADSYSFAIDWRPGTLVSAFASLGVLVVWLRTKRRGEGAKASGLILLVRLILILGTLVAILGLNEWRVFGALFSFIVPWIWVWVPTLAADDAEKVPDPVRGLLAMVLLFQTLHAYPVGGIQICWGSFLWLTLLALAGPETLRQLSRSFAIGRRVAQPIAYALGLLVAAKLGWMTWDHHREFNALTPVDLPGSGALRLSTPESATYRVLSINSILHGDVLFSLPGMFSFNLWSEVPTPNLRNTTLWYRLLDEADQRSIIDDLAAADHPVVIVDWQMLQLAAAMDMAASGPLHDYLMSEFHPAFMARHYGFMVRKGRAIAPFGTAWGGSESSEIQVCVLGQTAGVTRIQLLDQSGSPAGLPAFTASNGRVVVQPVDQHNQPRGEASSQWPLRWSGPGWLTISSDDFDPTTSARWAFARLEYDDGSAPVVVVRSGG